MPKHLKRRDLRRSNVVRCPLCTDELIDGRAMTRNTSQFYCQRCREIVAVMVPRKHKR